MYYIYEHQHRPDGITNVADPVARMTEQSATSYFHRRISDMSMTDLYTSVAIYLADDNLRKIDHKIVKTLWTPPEPEPEPTPEDPPVTEPEPTPDPVPDPELV